MQIFVAGFKEFKNLYIEDHNFAKAWKACKVPLTFEKTKWLDFIFQDGMLFKGSQLCILKSSMRENLNKQKHSGGLAGNFGWNKTFSLVVEHYYQPQL